MRGRCRRDCMVVGYALPMQSVPITTDVIKFVSDLQQVSGFIHHDNDNKIIYTMILFFSVKIIIVPFISYANGLPGNNFF
jgi:hypothetical protein